MDGVHDDALTVFSKKILDIIKEAQSKILD